MMAAGKKKPDTQNIERSLRDVAEDQLASVPKHSSDLKGQTPEQIAHELQVHQIELDIQAEELKKSRLALEESRDKFLDLYDFAPNGYLTLSDKGLIVEVNLTGATLLGVERSRLLKTRFGKYIVEKDADVWHWYFINLLNQDEKKSCTLMLKRAGGSAFPVQLEGRRFISSDRTITVRIAISDITDIKKSEDALLKTNEYLNNLFDHANAPIIVWDPEFRITRFNHAFENLTLIYEQEVVGQRLDILFPEESKDRSLLEIQKTIEGERWVTVEIPILVKDGSVRTVLWNSANIVNPEGRIISTIAQGVDITERKQAEAALLRVNQKLNVISHLTRTELTSQIFVLNGYVTMAKIFSAGQDRVIGALEKGERAILSINGTIASSKDYQDMGVKPPLWQNVKKTMLFGLSHLSIGKIQHSLETGNLEIFADPLLEKAFQHLAGNSFVHGDHVTRIRLWHTITPDGINLIFEDDGIGILPEKKEQIFLRSEDITTSVRDLFFVHDILEITGITIRETGEPGKGARFEMIVPNGIWRLSGSGT